MSQNVKQVSINNFTGFIAHYKDGRKVREKEDYFNKKLNKKCATNWAEINKDLLVAIELLWDGKSRIKITKEEYPHINSKDWLFFQTGYFDLKSKGVTVLGRSIGFIKDDMENIFSIDETNGILKIFSRIAKKK